MFILLFHKVSQRHPRSVCACSAVHIDSGLEEAKYAKKILEENGIENDKNREGKRRYFVSDKTQNFSVAAGTLLGEDIENECEFVDIFKYVQD